jgi:hypothetical protein
MEQNLIARIVALLSSIGGVLLFVGFAFLIYVGGPWAGEELWWRTTIGPDFARAQELEKEDKPAEALPIALSLLKTRSNDPRVLHFISGLYVELDDPLMAYFYLQTLTAAQGHFGIYQSDEYDLLSNLPIFHEQHMIDETLRGEIDKTHALYDQLGEDAKRSAPPSPNAVLNEPAATGAEPGYFNPEYLIGCGEHKICNVTMGEPDLFAAVAAQRAEVHDPSGGADCCSVSLTDPDLRRLEVVQDEFVKQWQADHPDSSITASDGANALLQFRARVLAKQHFVVDFVQSAKVKMEPKAYNPEIILIVRYAGGILCLALYIAVMVWIDRRKASKKKNA